MLFTLWYCAHIFALVFIARFALALPDREGKLELPSFIATLRIIEAPLPWLKPVDVYKVTALLVFFFLTVLLVYNLYKLFVKKLSLQTFHAATLPSLKDAVEIFFMRKLWLLYVLVLLGMWAIDKFYSSTSLWALIPLALVLVFMPVFVVSQQLVATKRGVFPISLTLRDFISTSCFLVIFFLWTIFDFLASANNSHSIIWSLIFDISTQILSLVIFAAAIAMLYHRTGLKGFLRELNASRTNKLVYAWIVLFLRSIWIYLWLLPTPSTAIIVNTFLMPQISVYFEYSGTEGPLWLITPYLAFCDFVASYWGMAAVFLLPIFSLIWCFRYFYLVEDDVY